MQNFPLPSTIMRKIHSDGINGLRLRVVQEFQSPSYRSSVKLLTALRGIQSGLTTTPSLEHTSHKNPPLVACYKLTDLMTSFDFAFFLAAADATAQEQGLRSFEVVLVRRRPVIENVSENDHTRGEINMDWRLNNILKPLADYYPNCIRLTEVDSDLELINSTRNKLTYPAGFSWNFSPDMDYREVFTLIGHGTFVGFAAPKKGKEIVGAWLKANGIRKNFITITLRKRLRDPSRDSNFSDWIKFASWMSTRGIEVVFIPDSESAMDPSPELSRFHVFTPASWNIGLRLAIYDIALVNMGVNNGPMALLNLTRDSSYIQFRPNSDSSIGNFRHYQNSLGLNVNDPRLPSATKKQLTVWGTDDLPGMKSAFNRWKSDAV